VNIDAVENSDLANGRTNDYVRLFDLEAQLGDLTSANVNGMHEDLHGLRYPEGPEAGGERRR
jgi:hypothetical protein